jgi:hypothetical protein
MRSLLIVIALFLFAVPCGAQPHRAPRFRDYPSKSKFAPRRARINIHSTPFTPCFRTILRQAVVAGDRFAGHYRVVQFGCGTECLRVAITDLVSGRTYISPFAVGSAGIEVAPGSRLLIANSPEKLRETYGDAPPPYVKTQYFIWNGRGLKEIEGGKLRREPEREFKTCSEMR